MSIIGKKILSVFNTASKNSFKRGVVKPFNESHSIGILYSWGGAKKEELITAFIEKINAQRIVAALCYNPDKNAVIQTTRPIVNITDLTVLGKINSASSNEFLSKKFDFLFHLDFELDEITKALLIKSLASCRIGIHTDKSENPYELMISINESAGLENLTEQMLKYVNALK